MWMILAVSLPLKGPGSGDTQIHAGTSRAASQACACSACVCLFSVQTLWSTWYSHRRLSQQKRTQRWMHNGLYRTMDLLQGALASLPRATLMSNTLHIGEQ